MNATTRPTAIRYGATRGDATRRSPLLMAAVVAVHTLLIVALLQSTLTAPLLDSARDNASGRGSERPEVVLLEPALAETIPPTALSVDAFMPTNVDLPSPPVLDFALADLIEEERLRGLYLGQVRARIARAWQDATRRGAEATMPRCIAVITQGADGDVREVNFRECPIPEPARREWAQVIRNASPLPAPPSSLPWGAQVEISLEVPP